VRVARDLPQSHSFATAGDHDRQRWALDRRRRHTRSGASEVPALEGQRLLSPDSTHNRDRLFEGPLSLARGWNRRTQVAELVAGPAIAQPQNQSTTRDIVHVRG